MIKRILESIIRNELATFQKAIVVLGARQVGKTTLLKEITKDFDKLVYLNADEPGVRQLLRHADSDQLRQLFGEAEAIVIDEAQRVEDIGLTLKIIVDQMPGVRLFVSGSSSLDLAGKINEPLTGRKIEHVLYPLTFQEMVSHHGLWREKNLLSTRLIYGYYPEIVTHPGHEITLLKNLTGSYLYQDILALGRIKKPVVLDKLLQALALQTGQEVKYNELAETVGADKETVERYIDLLEKSFIVLKLTALGRNVRNEIKKGKKIYFYDNGIRNAILGDFRPFDIRQDKGALWENFIISERKKFLSYRNFYGRLYFWRTTQKQEVDLIEEADGRLNIYEIKWNPKKKPHFPRTLLNHYLVEKTRVINSVNFHVFLSEPNPDNNPNEV